MLRDISKLLFKPLKDLQGMLLGTLAEEDPEEKVVLEIKLKLYANEIKANIIISPIIT